MSDLKLYLAPIQGITDHIFRSTFNNFFPGTHKAFTPFVRFQKSLEIKKSQIADIQPENNSIKYIVPQVLSNKASEIIYFASLVKQLGYSEINWNLGCPFPMVVNRNMGSGLLKNAGLIDEILETVFQNIKIDLSIKMRTGYLKGEEIFPVLEVLNKYPVSEIIIHPRVGKQMYSGYVDLDLFEECLKITKHQVCYNGDIKSLEDFVNIQQRFNKINACMLGRGAISNPFLFEEISNNTESDTIDKLERFSEFHHKLFELYENILSGPGHLLDKMLKLWEYFSISFEEPRKVLKMIKKSNSVDKYNQAIYEIFNNMKYIT